MKELKFYKIDGSTDIIVIFLHGFGANNSDLISLKEELNINNTCYFLQAPFCLQQNSYAWFPRDHENLSNINSYFKDLQNENDEAIYTSLDEIENFIKTNNLDKKELIFIGFSQGAILSYLYPLFKNENITKLVLLSPSILDYINLNNLKLNKDIKYLITHGTYDNILPIQNSKEVKILLDKNSFKGEFFEFNGEHEITYEVIQEIKNFLIK